MEYEVFYARYKGSNENVCNMKLKKGDVYRLKFISVSCGDWRWYRVLPVDRASLGLLSRAAYRVVGQDYINRGGGVEIPYKSVDAFLDNWEILYDENGGVAYDV